MSRYAREKVNEAVSLLGKAIEKIKSLPDNCGEILANTQDFCIALGMRIEKIKGLGTSSVEALENICESIYSISVAENEADLQLAFSNLTAHYASLMESVAADFPDKIEVLFIPYKASMWDSLESIWEAAEADPECEAYVVPIPYFEKNEDGTFKQEHYEGNLLPKNVPVIDYHDYDLEAHHPDAIFFHNPYDANNHVTTVHPDYYSKLLRKNTDCLIYVPYFASAGGMGEAWGYADCFAIVDYIVVQSKDYINYYDKSIPREKFLPFGSPKFDSIIHKCANPPAVPVEWQEQMKGKKVYFYNTSIGGMLANTENFLKKLDYVFSTFKKHPEVCLVWRPHPLLESTFESMRPAYKPIFDDIKNRFLNEKMGIYDDTPDMEATIANCDAYIGDAGTSVISIFGVAGKPMFLLNNDVHEAPTKEDVLWSVVAQPSMTVDGFGQDQYCVTAGNKLFERDGDGCYRYFCNLSKYKGGSYYFPRAYKHDDEIIVFPCNAQDILIIDKESKKITKIALERQGNHAGAFYDCWIRDGIAYIFPNRYESLVLFNLETKEVFYVHNFSEFTIAVTPDMQRIICAKWFDREGNLCAINPSGDKVFVMNPKTMKIKVIPTQVDYTSVFAMAPQNVEDETWFFPYQDGTVICWNTKANTYRRYDLALDGVESFDRLFFGRSRRYLFWNMIREGDFALFGPNWGNSFVKLNIKTGEATRLEVPFDTSFDHSHKYIPACPVGLIGTIYCKGELINAIYDGRKRCWYRLNNNFVPSKLVWKLCFDVGELTNIADGFGDDSEWVRYACNEDAVNSLEDFITGKQKGEPFSKEKQLESFGQVNASPDGSCGEKTYTHIKKHLLG